MGSLGQRQAEARRLLQAAGYGPNHPHKFTLTMRNTSDPMLIYPAVQADWKDVGVQASLAPEEGQIAFADYRARNFQGADAAWIGDYNDPMTYLTLMKSTTGQQNYGDYKNPAFDALLDKADQETDPIKRGEYLKRAERMAMEEVAVAPLYHYVSKGLVSPRLTGWVPNLADWHRTRYLCFAGHKPPAEIAPP